jgi:DNA polymerase III delta prime subunit
MTKKIPLNSSVLLIVDRPTGHKELANQFLLDQGLLKRKVATGLVWFNQEEESLKIATVREFINKASYGTYAGEDKISVLLHVDQGSQAAQNALLKIVEEPPANTTIVLTATDAHDLLPTIKSRCLIQYLDKAHQEKELDQETKEIIDHWLQLLKKPQQISYSQIIDFAQNHKRTEAKTIVRYLINKLHQQPQKNRQTLFSLKQLLKVYNQLDQNLNVKLSLENCLFKIKRSS